ncbi:hypothetical protein [Ottowia sp. oral taxon 894]|uniref:hypothetical protein n=1 Tax=Ottowia sp. oral taxon 894 TaxID=1658672 RepID=UPI00155DB087|nr:hypothetical protein [Ottowia sp. oral taxon 894]
MEVWPDMADESLLRLSVLLPLLWKKESGCSRLSLNPLSSGAAFFFDCLIL